MAKVYYNRVVLGNLPFSEVPEKFKETVKQMLIESGNEDLLNE